MPNSVAVVDYGAGNLLSVARAFENAGADVHLVSEPNAVLAAERLVLPGVGAFGDGMAELHARGLGDAIKRWVENERPLLGICLGMQMLMEFSEEFGNHAGLGLVEGGVTAIPRANVTGVRHKVPHIGWNELLPGSTEDWRATILERTSPGEAVYFVHSFEAQPQRPAHRLAECNYNGLRLAAVISSGLVYGCQFHPEKSGPTGLRIISSFLNL
jgi:imidazole glycerol-phosphate synthase subunit HisH